MEQESNCFQCNKPTMNDYICDRCLFDKPLKGDCSNQTIKRVLERLKREMGYGEHNATDKD